MEEMDNPLSITGADDNEIIITLDVMLAKRKMSVSELADRIGIHVTNLSIFKNGKAVAVKLKTLMRMCKVLDCTPNDLIRFEDPNRPPVIDPPKSEAPKMQYYYHYTNSSNNNN
jgi:putative transcriptional regulator